ncbi:hypothetical protein EON80_25445 [bacterium]|nr:MAG: hypothetical protein EON80_25445 [bacterium]
MELPFDWERIAYDVSADETVENYLEDRLDQEVPGCQASPKDFWFLGPEYWLLQEIACVDFCHHELGVDRNQELYRCLETIVTCGSFCATFGNLCLCCERPVEIWRYNGMNLRWRDGEIYN